MLRTSILTCKNPTLGSSPAQGSGFILRSEQIHCMCQRCFPDLRAKTLQGTTEAARFKEESIEE